VFKRIADAALRQVGVPATIRPIPPILVTAGTEQTAPSSGLPRLIPVLTPIGNQAVMPDLRGYAARDAVRALGAIGLSVRLHGSGFVASQKPEPGQTVDTGDVGILELRRQTADGSRSPGSQER